MASGTRTAASEGNGNSAMSVFGYPVMPSIFLVKPDKSYAKVGNSSVFNAPDNAGVPSHECDPTEIKAVKGSKGTSLKQRIDAFTGESNPH